MLAEIVGAAGGTLGVFGLLFRFQQTRINKIEERKQDTRACDSITKTFKEELDRGTRRFDVVDGKLDKLKEVNAEQSTSLQLIEQQISFIAKQNGYKP